MSLIWTFLGTKIGRYVLIGLGVVIALWLYGQIKEREGYASCKAEWAEAEANAQKTGRDARDGAARDVRDGVRDPFDRDDN